VQDQIAVEHTHRGAGYDCGTSTVFTGLGGFVSLTQCTGPRPAWRELPCRLIILDMESIGWLVFLAPRFGARVVRRAGLRSRISGVDCRSRNEDFTPISGLVGGVLIGFACALLMRLNGRIAGVSGVFPGLLPLNITAMAAGMSGYDLWQSGFAKTNRQADASAALSER